MYSILPDNNHKWSSVLILYTLPVPYLTLPYLRGGCKAHQRWGHNMGPMRNITSTIKVEQEPVSVILSQHNIMEAVNATHRELVI